MTENENRQANPEHIMDVKLLHR